MSTLTKKKSIRNNCGTDIVLSKESEKTKPELADETAETAKIVDEIIAKFITEAHKDYNLKVKDIAKIIEDNYLNSYYGDNDDCIVISYQEITKLNGTRRKTETEVFDYEKEIDVQKEREQELPLTDRDVIQKIHQNFTKVLQDVPVSDGNRALRHEMEKAVSMIDTHLSTVSDQSISEQSPEQQPASWTDKVYGSQSPALTLPTEAPIKWTDRKTFIVNDIKDNYTRQRLQANPDIEQQIRESPDAQTFCSLVWQPYVDIGLLQEHLKKFDSTLIGDLFTQQGKISEIIPTKKQRTDSLVKIIENQGFTQEDIIRLGQTLKTRKGRQANVATIA